MEPGLDLNLNYTWSHTIDNVSSTFSESTQTENLGLLDPFQPALEKGLVDLDARHRAALTAVCGLLCATVMHGRFMALWVAALVLIALTSNPTTAFNIISPDFDGLNIYFRVVLPDAWNAGPSQGQNAETRQEPNRYQHVVVPGDLAGSKTYLNPPLRL